MRIGYNENNDTMIIEMPNNNPDYLYEGKDENDPIASVVETKFLWKTNDMYVVSECGERSVIRTLIINKPADKYIQGDDIIIDENFSFESLTIFGKRISREALKQIFK